LWYLYLNNNQLSGEIPAELGNLSNLFRLYLNDNQLSGSIPAELGNLSNLFRLYLNDNKLSGSIPEELGYLGNNHGGWMNGPFHLYLENNELCGNTPASFENLNYFLFTYGVHISLDDNQPPCPEFFTTPTVEVAENASTLTLTIHRVGDGTLEVDYATTDGTALDGHDYIGVTGRLTWADGDSSDKTLTITITDDGNSEGPETFTVSLFDPQSGESLESLTVTITDNDTTAVTLASFTATALETGGIRLEWQTALELDNAGFHLWRASGDGWKQGDYSTVTRLTEQLIPARGNSASYSYIDYNVESGVTYYYGLEDFDLTGQSTFHWDFIDSAMAK
jgi:hypothetical protein